MRKTILDTDIDKPSNPNAKKSQEEIEAKLKEFYEAADYSIVLKIIIIGFIVYNVFRVITVFLPENYKLSTTLGDADNFVARGLFALYCIALIVIYVALYKKIDVVKNLFIIDWVFSALILTAMMSSPDSSLFVNLILCSFIGGIYALLWKFIFNKILNIKNEEMSANDIFGIVEHIKSGDFEDEYDYKYECAQEYECKDDDICVDENADECADEYGSADECGDE